MTRSDFMRSLRAAHGVLDELRLLRNPRWWAPLEPSSEFIRIAFAGETKYTELYAVGLTNRDYNVLLTDFSYLQFWISEAASTGAPSLRYGFYPNPYPVVSFEDFVSLTDVDPFDPEVSEYYTMYLEEQEATPSIQPLRYDYSPSSYKLFDHPAAHFHIGASLTIRIPASRVLSPELFALLVAKHYYAEQWIAIRNDEAKLEKRLGLANSECAGVENVLFDHMEQAQPHLT